MKWNELSINQRAEIISMAVKAGMRDMNSIRSFYDNTSGSQRFDDGGQLNPYSAGRLTDIIYNNAKQVKELGIPSHNYDFTIPEQEADARGYYKDNRGHRDDRVKKSAHPTHPYRGKWEGINKFILSDLGMEDPNYTMFGMADGGQDPQAVMVHNNSIVLPELTITPNGNYIHNSYDNLNIYKKGGYLTRKFDDGGFTSSNNTVDIIQPWQNTVLENGQFIKEYNYTLPDIIVTGKNPFKELPIQDIGDNEYINSNYEKDLINTLKNEPKEDIKKLQTSLADNGYYDINPDNYSIEEIKRIQKKIGAKVDGIFGKESKEKWRKYNIDGIAGNKTIDALKRSYNTGNWDDDVSTLDTEWCAEWVHKKVDNATNNGNYGVYGDAWKMHKNIENRGGTILYNIYDGDDFKEVQNVKDLKNKTSEAIKDNPFDIKQLKVGDIIGIYMPSSNMHEEAMKEGSTYNTHVGVVTGFNNKGIPIIEHNIHRVHHKDPANKLTGSLVGDPKIAVVTRPNYRDKKVPFYIQSAESQYTDNNDSPLFREFANSVAGTKSLVNKIFPDVDTDIAEQITLAVQGRETGFMKNRQSDLTGLSKAKADIGNFYRDYIKRKDDNLKSSNLAKMKVSSLTKEEQHMLGIKSAEDLENPSIAGPAAMYLISKNYNYFKQLQKTYPNLNITDDDIVYLTELSYNQGMHILKSIGFNENGAAPEELKAIREMAKEDAKIKDITATNYRHLGLIGEWIYDNFGKEHTPYISAAESYRKKLIQKKDSHKLGGHLFNYEVLTKSTKKFL